MGDFLDDASLILVSKDGSNQGQDYPNQRHWRRVGRASNSSGDLYFNPSAHSMGLVIAPNVSSCVEYRTLEAHTLR